jgi:hypothetical protein
MSTPVLQFKRGNLNNLNFGLRAGEPALTLDTFDLFVGINSIFEDNKFFGSHRYWEREDGNRSLRLRLVDSTGNVENSIHLKSPDSHTGITTYTLPSEPVAGEFLQVDANGNLSWASDFGEINVEELFANDATFGGNVAFTTTTASTDPTTGGVVVTGGLGVGGDVNIGEDLGVTGIGTFAGAVTIYDDTQSTDKDTGALVLEGGLGVEKNVNLGGDLGVTGSATISSTVDSIDINTGALVVEGGVGIEKSVNIGDNLTVGDNLYVGGTSEFVGVVTFRGGIINIGDDNTDDINVGGEFVSSLVPNTDDLHNLGEFTKRWSTLYAVNVDTTDLNVAGFSTFSNFANFSDSIGVFGDVDVNGDIRGNRNLSISGVSTFTGSIDSTSVINTSGLNVSGITTVNDFQTNGNTTIGDGSGDTLTIEATSTINGNSTFNGSATFLNTLVGTISTATRSTVVDTIETQTDQNYYLTFVEGFQTTQSQIIRTDFDVTYNPNTNTLTSTNLRTNNIKNTAGTDAVAIDAFGAVALSNNLTIAGNLFVNGSTTVVNTETLNVKDSLIDIGQIDDGFGTLVPPTSDLNKDIGMLFNYFDDASRKAAVYWDDSETTIAFASRVTESFNVLTAEAYATLDIGGLRVKADCTAGNQPIDVISCENGELTLSNIVIDGGSF